MSFETDDEDAEENRFWERLERYGKRGNKDKAEQIVADIWRDVTDRRGWRQEADQFDAETKNMILDVWLKIVRKRLK